MLRTLFAAADRALRCMPFGTRHGKGEACPRRSQITWSDAEVQAHGEEMLPGIAADCEELEPLFDYFHVQPTIDFCFNEKRTSIF